tara:strand:- start:2269 stop:2787 length:519 start_codon:yes stop_codon:yes gene_type:complete
MKNILAVDQALSTSGYWIDDGTNGLIKTKPETPLRERLFIIRSFIKDLCEKHLIELIVMEGYSFGSRNTKFTFTAGEVGGTIKLLSFDLDIPLIIVSPTLLKKYVCGKGNVKKEQMLLQVYKKYNREFDNNNICDAYCLNEFVRRFKEYELNSENISKKDEECFKKLSELNG